MLKDNPTLWQELYASNDTRTFAGYGFADVEKITLHIDEPPQILHAIRGPIEEFWEEFTRDRAGFTNDTKYATQGFDHEQSRHTLTLRVFPTDYATCRFKNSRSSMQDEHLTDEQRRFFADMLILGVGAYLSDGKNMLLGLCEKNMKKGLLENIPQGLVEPHLDHDDILFAAFARELSEETGLSVDALSDCCPTHLNVGKKFGDLTIIYHGEVLPGRKMTVHSREHAAVWWMDETIMQAMMYEYPLLFNPVTVALFKAL